MGCWLVVILTRVNVGGVNNLLNYLFPEIYSGGQDCSTLRHCWNICIQSLTFKPVLADPASWWREEEPPDCAPEPSSSLHQLAGSAKTGLKVRDWMQDVLTQPSNVWGCSRLDPQNRSLNTTCHTCECYIVRQAGIQKQSQSQSSRNQIFLPCAKDCM